MTGIPAKIRDAPGQLAIRKDWLLLRREPVLEPDLPAIDGHHHIWDPPGARYLFDDYMEDARSGHNIVASVFITCHSMYRGHGPEAFRSVGETEFIAGVAAQSESGRYGPMGICAAIVGAVDYSLGSSFEPVLDAHQAASGGRLRGFRGRTSSHPDPEINQWRTPDGVLRENASRQAISVIARRGLVLEIYAYQTQIDDILALCDAFPDLQIVIDHAGGPLVCGPYRGHRSEMFASWANGVRTLATRPNTYLKFSGMGMRFPGFDFHQLPEPPSSDDLVAAWRAYFETCIEAFQPSRCMFGSNFPADKGSYSFGILWNAFKKLTRDLSDEERAAVHCDTAKRVYRISVV